MKCKSCYSPHVHSARPHYDCCGSNKCAPKIPHKALKITGSVSKTNVYNEDFKISSVLNTFYLHITNCTEKTLHDVWLDINIRVLECACDGPIPNGQTCSCCFNPDDIQILTDCNPKSHCNPCCPSLEKFVDDCGVHVKLNKVNPGVSIVTVIVPLQNPQLLCPPPCSILPSLFTLRIVKCFCDEQKVLFQTSTVIGCNPAQICCNVK